MKRELKINYGELRQVHSQVLVFQHALEDIEIAASRFEGILTEQESEAVTALVNWRREELQSDIEYFRNNLQLLSKLLMDYIEDMTSAVKPNNENAMMLVDRNDIWMNLKQIEWNTADAGPIASGMGLNAYSGIDTYIPPLHISADMTASEAAAAREEHRKKIEEKKNRQENYEKLESFCNGTASSAKRELESLYEQLEDIYQRNIVVYENTDDRYKSEARSVYDACTSFRERVRDLLEKSGETVRDIGIGAIDAVVDMVKGVLQLAFFLAKVSAAMQTAAIMAPLGITPKWVKETKTEAEETLKAIGKILDDPGRALAALGQQASDTIEEKGFAYGISYVLTDAAIGIAVDKGLGKLKGLSKADEISDAAKAVDKLDDVPANTVDNIKDAIEGGLDSGLTQSQIADIVNTPKGSRPNPSSYLSQDYIDAHLAQFDDGLSVIQTEWAYGRYSEINGFVGVPDDNTLFVIPKKYCDEVIAKANGDIAIIEFE